MDKELYTAAVRGDSDILEKASIEREYHLLQRTLKTENNIMHIAVRHERLDFVREVLLRFPELISKTNSRRETPFHLAAETGNTSILEVLLTSYNEFQLSESFDSSSDDAHPWRVQNLEGNTPLHVALIHGKVKFAAMLVETHPGLAGFVNNSDETPLHLAITYRIDSDRHSVLQVMKQVTYRLGANFQVQCPPKESSDHIITLLLGKNVSTACSCDSNGLTPLLRAASLRTPYVSAIRSILEYCPESIEVYDPSGRNILHLLNELIDPQDCKYLLSLQEIHGLKNHQDLEGNTPAHIAVKKQNISLVQLLLRLSANFAIKNKEGLSVADLLQQQSDEFYNRLVAKGTGMLFSYRTLDGEKGRLEKLIRRFSDSNGCSITWDGAPFRWGLEDGNILHHLLCIMPTLMSLFTSVNLWENGEIQEFIKQVLDSHPSRICETARLSVDTTLHRLLVNAISGDTPLHVIARIFPRVIDGPMLKMFSDYFDLLKQESDVGELYLPPWRMKNADGNTPLHVALLTECANLRCAVEFLKLDAGLADIQNDNKETPLHLLSKVTLSLESFKDFTCVEWGPFSGCVRDKDGLTPLLKAAQENNLPLVKLLYTLFEQSAFEAKKDDGRTFWHLLANQTAIESDYEISNLDKFLKSFDGHELDFFTNVPKRFWRLVDLLYEVDNDGNTPFHLAIDKANFRFAQFFIEYFQVAQERSGVKIWPYILTVRNNKDITPAALIGTAEHMPREFEDFLWRNPYLVKDLLGVRSLSGISTPMIKGYTNTLGVVAALLATITFTAAFTVPGGLNSNNGTPILMNRAAFQVFMISDILAMCLSTAVLFCLLWIMTMSNRKESVVLLDLTIYLLRLSFYATLVAFMTGLYGTTFSVAPWIAIFSCALCSSLILLMHKSLIALCIPGFIKIFFLSRQATTLFSDFLCLLLCGASKRAIICCSQQLNQNNGEGRSSSVGRGSQTEQAIPHLPN